MTNLVVYTWRDGTRISVFMSELLDPHSEIKCAIAFLNILHGQAEISQPVALEQSREKSRSAAA